MWLDILLVLLIAAALFLALRSIIRARRQGKTCSCGCSSCASRDRCADRPR